MAEYPISADRAEAIRATFAQRASEGRERLAQLRSTSDPLADTWERQVASWERMSVRPFETMPMRGTI